jgi:hypothetical protein
MVVGPAAVRVRRRRQAHQIERAARTALPQQ